MKELGSAGAEGTKLLLPRKIETVEEMVRRVANEH